jgi:hypothetical protein
MTREPVLSAELRTFIDRVIVPALLERFLRDQAAPRPSASVGDLPKAEATV